MASLKERLTRKLDRVRERRHVVDHAVKMFLHYGSAKATIQAGAVTFFGFLSFFPILALAFFVIGYVARVYPGAQDDLVEVINQLFPGMLGDGEGQIQLSTFEEQAGAIGLIGLVGVLYSGLGWLSAMREALAAMFVNPQTEHPNLLVGKGRDLLALAVIGLTLIVSVSISGLVTGFSKEILEWAGLGDVPGTTLLLGAIAALLGVLASTVLFFWMYKLLARPHVPRGALIRGSLLAAVGFEVLKLVATQLIGLTESQPAFQAFGIALVLLVWINYFSRVTMLGAAWAFTSRATQARRRAEGLDDDKPADDRPADEGGDEDDEYDDEDEDGPSMIDAPRVRREPTADDDPASTPLQKPEPSPVTALAPELEEPYQPIHRAEAGKNGAKKAIAAGGVLAGVAAVGAVAALRKRRSH